MVKPQTILLVDDHSLITTAMSALLQSMYPDVQIHVGATAKEAVELAEKYGDSADLMILDLGLPDSQGTDLLVRLLQNYPALKILVLSGNCDPDSILKALSAGAAGYVPKTLDATLLKSTINFVLEGGVYNPSKVLSQVLKHMSQGDTIKTLCRKMDLSEGTIKTHVTALYRAFDARNRTEALIAARRNGFNVD